MATPTADSYSVASGLTLYAGRSGAIDLSGDWVVAGDSLTSLGYPSGGYRFGFPATLYPPRVIYNAGVTNNTIQDLINRFTADVISKNPKVCALRIGTNGPGTGTYQDRFTDLFNAMAGATPPIFGVIHAVPPKGLGTTGVAAPNRAINTWLAAQCSANPTRLLFVDDSLGLGDADYNAVAAYYIDLIHMNGKGVYTQGKAMAAVLAPLLPQVDPRLTVTGDVYPANAASNQYCPNPLMTGAGPVATGWEYSANGAGTVVTPTLVAADAGDPVQVPWQRLTLNSIGAGGSVSLGIPCTNPAIAADTTIKRLDVIAEVRLNALDTTNMTFLSLGGSAAGVPIGAGGSANIGNNGVLTERLVLRQSIPRNQGGAALTAISANAIYLGISILFENTQTSGVGSFDVRCASLRGQTT